MFRWYMPEPPPRDDTCWEWRGSRGPAPDHYGKIGARGRGAHVVSYLIHVGSISSGEQVRHTCDNPPCVNPDHLIKGSISDNMQDKVDRSRQARGEKVKGSKLTESDVVEIRRLYASGSYTYKDIAQQFDVSTPAVFQIVKGKTWAHVALAT